MNYIAGKKCYGMPCAYLLAASYEGVGMVDNKPERYKSENIELVRFELIK
jgi:hypothetical protein